MRLLKSAFVLGLALVTLLLLSGVVLWWPPRLGIDLAGGVRLIYEVDRTRLAEDGGPGDWPAAINWGRLLQAVENRVNPSGMKEVTVRRLGDWQIEIIVPTVDPVENEQIKKLLSASGCLEFRVLANRIEDEALVQRAEQQAQDPEQRKSRYVKAEGRIIGLWARVGRKTQEVVGGFRPLKVNVATATVRDAATGEILRVPEDLRLDQEFTFERWLQQRGIDQIEVLLGADDGFDVTGSHLGMVSRGYDEVARPCVLFNMTREGAARMAGLTGTNLPDERRGTYRLLGIVLDGTLLSAPRVMSTITDSGRITGQFTREEVDFIVSILQAGSLPVALGEIPMAETVFAPSEARRQTIFWIVGGALGLLAVSWPLLLVRYRRIGLAAAWANLLHLLLVLAAIELLRLPVTMSAVVAAAALLLVAAAGNVWICESVHRVTRRGAIPPGQKGRSLVGSVVLSAALLAAPLTILLAASIFAYVLLDSPFRVGAVAAFLGSLSAMATSCVCLPLLIGIFVPGPPDQTQEADVVVAEVVNPG